MAGEVNLFEMTGPHYCPIGCSIPDPRIPRVRIRVKMVVIEDTGQREWPHRDLCRCPMCGKAYVIRYRALKPLRFKSRDAVPDREYVQQSKG